MTKTTTKPSNGPTERPSERRRAPRFEADLPLNLCARDLEAGARLKDISALGLCCHFPEPVPEMTLVQIRMNLNKKEDFVAEGAVVRCDPVPGVSKEKDSYEVAVFFTNMDKDSRHCLDSYLGSKTASN